MTPELRQAKLDLARNLVVEIAMYDLHSMSIEDLPEDPIEHVDKVMEQMRSVIEKNLEQDHKLSTESWF